MHKLGLKLQVKTNPLCLLEDLQSDTALNGCMLIGCVLCVTVQGRVDVNQETGELKLLVKINAKSQGAEAKKSKAVKDLKQLSGMQSIHQS
jgi:hypothetical protein